MVKRIICITVATFCTVGIFLAVRTLTVRAQRPSRKPFTAFMVRGATRPGEMQPANQWNYSFSAFSNGSSVEISRRQMPDGNLVQVKYAVDILGGKRFVADPSTNSTTTWRIPDRLLQHFSSLREYGDDCTANPSAPHSNLLGYDVVEVKRDWQQPQRISATKWEAPALGCFALRQEINITMADGSMWKNFHEPLIVIEGEPAASLLELPSGYVERTPSQVGAEFARKYGQKAFNDNVGPTFDHGYELAR